MEKENDDEVVRSGCVYNTDDSEDVIPVSASESDNCTNNNRTTIYATWKVTMEVMNTPKISYPRMD